MRIYTATPMAVLDETDQDSNFFSRDMGLTCHGLQAAGVESKVVLLDFPRAKKHPDMIRATLEQMKEARFWRNLDLDAVVLGAWADPKYASIAKAIKESGTKVIVRCDTGRAYSPWQQMLKHNLYYNYLAPRYIGKEFLCSCIFSFAKTLKNYFSNGYVKGVIEHMGHADLIMNETPEGVRLLKELVCKYGRMDISAKVKYVPHPVTNTVGLDNQVLKEKRIIAVGRWDHYSKNTPMLIKTLAKVLGEYPDYEAHIFGGGVEVLERLCQKMPKNIQDKIHIRGRVLNPELKQEYQKSQILFMPSRSEGSSVAAEEALSFGCCVVGSKRIFCMRNFVSRNSGTLARKYSIDGMVEALSCEMDAWTLGLRKPQQIAEGWRPEISLDVVVQDIIAVVSI